MKELHIEKTTLKIGLEKPVTFLHVTDTHIVRDHRENGRAAVFNTTDEQIESFWFKTVDYAKEKGLTIIHTGDLVDYVTDENLEFLDKYLADVDYLLAPGSHDYGHKIPGAPEYFEWRAAGFSENDAYKAEQIKVVAPHVKNSMYFASKIIDGVNFVALDNSYLKITDGQLDALKAEVAKGYPVVVAMHIPIHTPEFQKLPVPPRENLCSTPEEQKEHGLRVGREDWANDIRIYSDSTWRAIEYMKTEPAIKVVLAGHRHRFLTESIGENKFQVITHAGCHGYAHEITLV